MIHSNKFPGSSTEQKPVKNELYPAVILGVLVVISALLFLGTLAILKWLK